jgi:hypothetical protein
MKVLVIVVPVIVAHPPMIRRIDIERGEGEAAVLEDFDGAVFVVPVVADAIRHAAVAIERATASINFE